MIILVSPGIDNTLHILKLDKFILVNNFILKNN